MNIVDDNNNNKGNDSEVKIQKIIINFTQTWDLCEDINDIMDINNVIDDNNNNYNDNDNKEGSTFPANLNLVVATDEK